MQTSYIALGYIQTYCEEFNVEEVESFEKPTVFCSHPSIKVNI